MADETPPEDAASDEQPTEDAASDEQPTEDAASDEQPAEDAASDGSADQDQNSNEPAYSEEEAEILARLEAELGDDVVDHADVFGTLTVRVRPGAWRRTAEVVKRELACDYLSFIAGIDWQPAPREGDDEGEPSAPVQPQEMTFGAAGSAGRFQVFAHVQSTTRHWGLTIKTDVDESAPTAESLVSVYPGADWHERECWEMYGIAFEGHPSLRHLYLPGEFEGHPLRKDFPLLARMVKPWPGLVDVEPMPEDAPSEPPSEVSVSPDDDEGGSQ